MYDLFVKSLPLTVEWIKGEQITSCRIAKSNTAGFSNLLSPVFIYKKKNSITYNYDKNHIDMAIPSRMCLFVGKSLCWRAE